MTTRPLNPKLAKLFDEAINRGDEIRFADETRLVIYRSRGIGCGGWILLILLGIVTVFIVPLILLLLGAVPRKGQTVTYTLKPNGNLKKRVRKA